MLKIMVIGNLTNDVELKMGAEGQLYAMLRVASDRRYKDRAGNKLTDFVSVKVRGKLAERCAAWGYKGAKVAAAGDFETITLVAEPGRQAGFLIKASEVQFLSGPKPAAENTGAVVVLEPAVDIEPEVEPDEKIYDEVV